MSEDYPANPYVEEIASRLWSGHAAIMVGAGFSKNAKKNTPNAPPFLSWAELGDVFFKTANARQPGLDDRYLDPLKLAEEVEAAMGRPALDRLLKTELPDNEYSPSNLHRNLLSLPWTDVYTTNYDTLLERAAQMVQARRYDVVVSPTDLVDSERPRIVKLHGSFPSSKPYIITEEDYRSYPNKFAPFVNTVQQSLLENTLVLIGFSGDDPNFLSWIGWIRDNLQNSAPKIYLVGALNPSTSQKQLLERRNIIVINLAPNDSDQPHYDALNNFLDILLKKGEQRNSLEWARTTVQRSRSDYEETFTSSQGIEQLIADWRLERTRYPNWYILPVDQRAILTADIRHCLEAGIVKSDDIEIDLAYYKELVWRVSIALVPLPNDFLNTIVSLLADPAASAKSFPGRGNQNEPDWVSLAISMLKFCRHAADLHSFNILNELLSQRILTQEPENAARIGYERSMVEFAKLNLQGVRRELDKWPVNASIPMLEARRAGLLAELGDLKKAKEIAKRSLLEVRNRLNLSPVKEDFELISAEAHIMALSEELELAASFEDGRFGETIEITSKYRDRKNELRTFKCDPWNELKLFSRELMQPPAQSESSSARIEFDVGRTSTHFQFQAWDDSVLAGYAFLRFSEEAGLPFRTGSTITRTSQAAGALVRIKSTFPALALTTLVRIGDPTLKFGNQAIVEALFDRKAMLSMTANSVDELSSIAITCYEYCLNQAGVQETDSSFESRMLSVLPEILSRLVTKASRSIRANLIQLIPNIYNGTKLQHEIAVNNLLIRLGDSIFSEELSTHLDTIISVQFTQNASLLSHPLVYLDRGAVTYVDSEIPQNLLVERIRACLESSDLKEIQWNLVCLIILNNMSLLTEETRTELGRLIWKNNEIDPDLWPFHLGTVLSLPHPEGIDPQSKLVQYVEHLELPNRTSENSSVGFPGPEQKLFTEISRLIDEIELGQNILNSLLVKMADWWNREKFALSRTPSAFGLDVTPRFKLFATLVSQLLLQLEDEDLIQNISPTFESIARELQDLGVTALILNLALSITKREPISLDEIEKQIASHNADDSIAGLRVLWFYLRNMPPEYTHNPDLAAIALNSLKWKSGEPLIQLFHYLHDLVEGQHTTFDEAFLSELSTKVVASEIDSKLDPTQNQAEISFRLALRVQACRLARTLYDLTQNRSLLVWQKVSKDVDEFAEVRNCWL